MALALREALRECEALSECSAGSSDVGDDDEVDEAPAREGAAPDDADFPRSMSKSMGMPLRQIAQEHELRQIAQELEPTPSVVRLADERLWAAEDGLGG